MEKHDCHKTGVDGTFLFICSRCLGCYICQHEAVYFSGEDKWMWKSRKRGGKTVFEPVICDGRLKVSAENTFQR
jgi:hypothetical protein